jgi:3-oxoadipate enol-lactonase
MRLRVALATLGVALLSTSAPGQVRTGMINVGDFSLRYELSGRGEAVVFVHGWANTLAIWDDQVPAFTQRYQVLRYDRRGFGRSTGFADVSADPDDLRILLDSLGIASAYVVGLSAGSEVATRFAFAYPQRTLALVRLSGPPPLGMPGAPPRARDNRDAMAHILRTYGMDSLHKFVLSQPGFVPPPDETAAERQRRLERLKKGWDYTGRDLLDPKPQSGRVPAVSWERIRELTVPTLLVNGARDNPRALTVADSLARYLPNVRRVVIPRAGHAANLSQPAQFNNALLEFFMSFSRRKVNGGDATIGKEIEGTGKPTALRGGGSRLGAARASSQ